MWVSSKWEHHRGRFHWFTCGRTRGTCAVVRALLLALLLLGCCGVTVVASQQAPANGAAVHPEARKVRVTWKNALIEEAIQHTAETMGGVPGLICDSLEADAVTSNRMNLEATPEEIAKTMASDYGRVLLKQGETYLMRHNRWYDLSLSKGKSRDATRRARALKVSRKQGTAQADRTARLDLSVLRATLQQVAETVGKAVGFPHRVDASLAQRRISGTMIQVTAKDIREALQVLFPDTRWEGGGPSGSSVSVPTRNWSGEGPRRGPEECRVRTCERGVLFTPR